MGDVQVTKSGKTMTVSFIKGFGKKKAVVKTLDVTGKTKEERDLMIQEELAQLRLPLPF